MRAPVQFPPICPMCGANALCFHQEIGGIDYLDEYKLVCENCGYKEIQEIRGGSPLADNYVNPCPYCGRDMENHKADRLVRPKVKVFKLEVKSPDVVVVEWIFEDNSRLHQVIRAPKTELKDGQRTILAEQQASS